MNTKHTTPSIDLETLAKVVFYLAKSDWHEYTTESMWASCLGPDQYQLENVPFYAYNVSYGDVVITKLIQGQLIFQGIAQRSGHSTYRVFLSESSTEKEFKSMWSALENLGCTYERATERLFAIDIPPTANIHQAYAALEKGEAQGVWDFEEANCAHLLHPDQ